MRIQQNPYNRQFPRRLPKLPMQPVIVLDKKDRAAEAPVYSRNLNVERSQR